MSLRVWLPLVRDLNNQGLSDVSVTNSGTTIIDNGKLGKCCNFSAGNMLTFSPTVFQNFKEVSISLWLNINAWNTAWDTYFQFGLGTAPWNSYNLGLLRSNTASKIAFVISNNSSSTQNQCISDALTVGTWYHVTCVYKTGHCMLYVNGALVRDISTTIVPNFAGITNCNIGRINASQYYNTNCKMNDFRIYDHALSAKEVKELSKGLVAHYTLGDRYLEGTTNLITSLTQGGQTTISGNSVTTSGQNKDTYFTINLSESIVSGTQYTISCYAEGIPDDSSWTFPLGAQSNTSLSWVIHNGYNAYTFTANSINWGTNHIFMDDISRTFYGITKFSNFQLEKKDHATGYAGMGGTRNEITVYDCSGYNNHLTAVNSPTIASDTARYSVSTHFNNGQYIIANENSNTGWLPTDSITVNLWTYITTWGNPISCTEGGGWNFEDAGGSSGIRFPIYVKGVGYVYKNSGVTTTSLLNGWHMLTGTFDKTTSKIYVDGELKGETTASTSNIIQYSSARLCISAEAQGTTPASSTMVGNISDVRIYATALSTEDIKELYQTSASIDKNGNFYAYELKEV